MQQNNINNRNMDIFYVIWVLHDLHYLQNKPSFYYIKFTFKFQWYWSLIKFCSYLEVVSVPIWNDIQVG